MEIDTFLNKLFHDCRKHNLYPAIIHESIGLTGMDLDLSGKIAVLDYRNLFEDSRFQEYDIAIGISCIPHFSAQCRCDKKHYNSMKLSHMMIIKYKIKPIIFSFDGIGKSLSCRGTESDILPTKITDFENFIFDLFVSINFDINKTSLTAKDFYIIRTYFSTIWNEFIKDKESWRFDLQADAAEYGLGD